MGPTSGRMGPVAGIASVCRCVISLPVGYRLPALRIKRISSLPTNGTMTNIARAPLTAAGTDTGAMNTPRCRRRAKRPCEHQSVLKC